MGQNRPRLEGDLQNWFGLWKGYFHNKMMIALLLLQDPQARPASSACLRTIIFLDDLYRHLLDKNLQEEAKPIFHGLILFYRRYPFVQAKHKQKALEQIRKIYEMFGIEFPCHVSIPEDMQDERKA